jgi:hypothetical protein
LVAGSNPVARSKANARRVGSNAGVETDSLPSADFSISGLAEPAIPFHVEDRRGAAGYIDAGVEMRVERE